MRFQINVAGAITFIAISPPALAGVKVIKVVKA